MSWSSLWIVYVVLSQCRLVERPAGNQGVYDAGCDTGRLVAGAAGWPVDLEAVEHRLEPVVAEEDIASDEVSVEAGQVAGAQETVKLQPKPGTAIEIFLRMSLGEPEEYDEVRIEGMPPITMRIEGGIHGDVATAGCTANVIVPTLQAPAGLLTVLNLPICS